MRGIRAVVVSAPLLLGAIFLVGTALRVAHLIYDDGLTIHTNLFGTTYYSLVGLHAFHVRWACLRLTTVLALHAPWGRTAGAQPSASRFCRCTGISWMRCGWWSSLWSTSSAAEKRKYGVSMALTRKPKSRADSKCRRRPRGQLYSLWVHTAVRGNGDQRCRQHAGRASRRLRDGRLVPRGSAARARTNRSQQIPKCPPVRTRRRDVSTERPSRRIHRAWLPLEIYPISAGVKGGLAGGVAMASLAMLYGLLSRHGIWYPDQSAGRRLLSHGRDHDHGQTLTAFHLRVFLIAIPIHLITSLLVGLLYGAMLPMLPAAADSAGRLRRAARCGPA